MITVVGESLVDVVARTGHGELTVHPGGSPANVAVALSRLGQRAALVTQIGADEYGELIRAHLAANGVELILAAPAYGATSQARATVDSSGAATYEFRLRWEVRDLRLAAGSVALHTGSLGVLLAPGGQHVLALLESACRRGGLVTSYDPNVRPSVTPDRRAAAATVERAAACAHIVKMSDEDLAFLYPGTTPRQIAARFLGDNRSTAILVVTKGREGAIVATRAACFSLPATAVAVMDTVGAGDAFTAAMLTALADLGALSPGTLAARIVADEHALRQITGRALAAAALTCTRRGADPPTAAELLRFRPPRGDSRRPRARSARGPA